MTDSEKLRVYTLRLPSETVATLAALSTELDGHPLAAAVGRVTAQSVARLALDRGFASLRAELDGAPGGASQAGGAPPLDGLPAADRVRAAGEAIEALADIADAAGRVDVGALEALAALDVDVLRELGRVDVDVVGVLRALRRLDADTVGALGELDVGALRALGELDAGEVSAVAELASEAADVLRDRARGARQGEAAPAVAPKSPRTGRVGVEPDGEIGRRLSKPDRRGELREETPGRRLREAMKAWRKAEGVTQGDAAKRAGIQKQTWNRAERGIKVNAANEATIRAQVGAELPDAAPEVDAPATVRAGEAAAGLWLCASHAKAAHLTAGQTKAGALRYQCGRTVEADALLLAWVDGERCSQCAAATTP